MYTERRKCYPPFPKSLNEAFTQLKENQNENTFMYKGQQFIHIPDNQLFICLTTIQNMEFMTTCTDFFGDGIFEYAPKYFVQLYTIHCFKNGHYIPVVYFFLNDKLKETYSNMWKFIVDLCFKMTNRVLNITNLHLDFEVGAHEAAVEIFPQVNIIGCRYHLGQAWWRKINSESKLRNAYKNVDDDLGNWLKMFFGLQFINHDEVEDAFVELIAVCPNEEIGHIFSDYILDNYIEPGCPFNTKLWAMKPSENRRTINAAESFHRTFNDQFYSSHPAIYIVIQTLIETQSETSLTITTIERSNKSSSNLLKYLEYVGLRYLAINNL
ncbi:uncharacterized protein LOC112592197 [Melanaphis sacchari]|uniref:uncharacterized protein LOC112592197 n=1 Tax=Melanaphis sacchari TaxID=742174 RepID=UPI000DC1528B|nr:uncharacterized protein LOC112592197 [Melanaphis sacchari]